MEDHPRLTSPWAYLLALVALAAGCEEPRLRPPTAHDQPLALVAVEPDLAAPLPYDAELSLTFSDWLDPDLLTFYNALALRSGGAPVAATSRYDFLHRTLFLVPRRALDPDLSYAVDLQPDALQSVTGVPYEGPLSLPFSTSPEPAPTAEATPTPTWEDVAPLLAPCGGCHNDPAWQLPPLTPEGMRGQPSAQVPGLSLLQPFAPERSYLLHKLAPNYPLTQGETQPPSWSGQAPLRAEDLEVIQRWILAGAPR